MLRELPALLIGLLLALTALADQNDPRLDNLFERLQTATDSAERQTVEELIWIIWSDSGQARINDLLEQGVSAMNARQLDEALALFDQVVKDAPAFAEGWNKRATVRYLRGELQASMADVQQTLALEPRHFGALSGMGLIFIQSGDEVGALQAYREVLKVHPHTPSARQQVEVLQARLRDRTI